MSFKKKTPWPPKGKCKMEALSINKFKKKKREKPDCGLNCVENYLKSTKHAIDDVDRKLIQVIKH